MHAVAFIREKITNGCKGEKEFLSTATILKHLVHQREFHYVQCTFMKCVVRIQNV